MKGDIFINKSVSKNLSGFFKKKIFRVESPCQGAPASAKCQLPAQLQSDTPT